MEFYPAAIGRGVARAVRNKKATQYQCVANYLRVDGESVCLTKVIQSPVPPYFSRKVIDWLSETFLPDVMAIVKTAVGVAGQTT